MDRTRRFLHPIALACCALAIGATPPDAKPKSGDVPPDLAPGSGELDTSNSELREAINRYTIDQRSLTRSIPSNWSEGRKKRLEGFAKDWLGSLDRVDFDALGRDGRIDSVLLRNDLDHSLRQLELQGKKADDVRPLVPYAETIVVLEESRRKMEPIDPAKVAGRLTDLVKEIEKARKAAEDSTRGDRQDKPAKSLALRAASTVEQAKRSLAQWHGFYSGYDPLYTWWAAEPYKAVDAALQQHATVLRERVAGIKDDSGIGPTGGDTPAPRRGGGGGSGGGRGGVTPGEGRGTEPREGREIVGDPIGREALLIELAHEMIPYTPEELARVAEKELAWCEAEMIKASRDLGCGDDWRKALEQVKTKFVEPGKQPALIRDLAQEAVEFLEKRDLVTIPPLAKETWRMEMMTPQLQLVNPFFTGGEVISVSFPTDGMTHEQKLMSMRGNNVHFSRATVHHELIPGHHLQGFMASRHRTYRRPFSTPFLVEGWALYWELRLWDLEFPKSPEDRIGMLFWRSHRCARILFSLNFHLGKMTPGECVNLLVDRIGHERANAEGEVRRSFDGNYSPLYQAAYLLGGLQLRALHDELVRPGKMTEKAFNDAVLKEGPIPIAMIRASLAGIDLDRDGKAASSWKFYGDVPEKP